MASSTLDAAMSTAGVTGAVCVDAGGMCLGARGDVDPELAAILAEPGHLDVDRAMLEPLFSGTLAISDKAQTTVEDFFLTSATASPLARLVRSTHAAGGGG